MTAVRTATPFLPITKTEPIKTTRTSLLSKEKKRCQEAQLLNKIFTQRIKDHSYIFYAIKLQNHSKKTFD